MTHLLVIDYPYYTLKVFFASIEAAKEYTPTSDLYTNYKKLLNVRCYELKEYSSQLKYIINFDVKIVL